MNKLEWRKHVVLIRVNQIRDCMGSVKNFYGLAILNKELDILLDELNSIELKLERRTKDVK